MNGVSRFWKPAALLGLLAALGLAGYGAGKAGATCYTGCKALSKVYDTHYSVTISLVGAPLIADFQDTTAPPPLCAGAFTQSRPYKNGGMGNCSAGPSRYKETDSATGNDGNITVNVCTSCT